MSQARATAETAIRALFGEKPEDLVNRILLDFTRLSGRFATGEDLEELAAALEVVARGLRALAGPPAKGKADDA